MVTGRSMTPPNILLVSVDCMRRDRISAYGYPRQTTPFLDGLLESAAHATSAHSTSSWTTPAVASMLTGLYPHNHGAGTVGSGSSADLSTRDLPSAVTPGVGSLPRMLAGYRSSAWSAIDLTKFGTPREVFDGGGVYPLESGNGLTQRALRWIGSAGDPFLCWVHLGDAHDPLDLPRSFRPFGSPRSRRRARRWGFTKREDDVSTDRFRRYLGDRILLYDTAVRMADEMIGKLWTALPAATRARTLLIVTADHGEALWEHRQEDLAFADPRNVAGVGHGHNLWQEVLLVPLIVIGPDVPPGPIDRNVSLVDLTPTILEAAGVDLPSGLDGISVLSASDAERPIVAEGVAYGYRKVTAILGDRKLLVSPGDAYEGFFRLDRERVEHPISAPADADALREILPDREAAGAPATFTDEERRATESNLRALGYIE